MDRKLMIPVLGIALSATLLYVAGCSKSDQGAADPQASKTPAVANKKDGDHEHKPGAHGGIIVAIGRDSYHAEAVFEKNGVLRLYTLGKDEGRVQEVESQTLAAYVKPEGGTESASFVLKPEPQQGDSPGKTSQFIGHLPRELWGQKVEVTIPSMTIAGERFRLGFASASEAHGGDMPQGVSADEEKKLYLTPGRIYTEADIKANGNMTASQKFKGFKAKHDLKPKKGDKICPVTLTKANPECSWVINGKKYEFCCPPCVDEFVALAKDPQTADEVKEPLHYLKK